MYYFHFKGSCSSLSQRILRPLVCPSGTWVPHGNRIWRIWIRCCLHLPNLCFPLRKLWLGIHILCNRWCWNSALNCRQFSCLRLAGKPPKNLCSGTGIFKKNSFSILQQFSEIQKGTSSLAKNYLFVAHHRSPYYTYILHLGVLDDRHVHAHLLEGSFVYGHQSKWSLLQLTLRGYVGSSLYRWNDI